MIRNSHKYLYFGILKCLVAIIISLLFYTHTTAQNIAMPKADSSKQKTLAFYHAFTSAQTQHPYTHIDYTRPNDQLMSWPNFPLTPTEVERRHRQYLQENKPSSVIAKDIITSILKKKTKVAVIPKF